jgi:hypothetical protein
LRAERDRNNYVRLLVKIHTYIAMCGLNFVRFVIIGQRAGPVIVIIGQRAGPVIVIIGQRAGPVIVIIGQRAGPVIVIIGS